MPVFVLHMHSVCTCCSGLQEMWEGNVLMKWRLLSWLRHVGYTVSPIQAWIPKTCHSYAWALHHLRLPFARNLSVGFRPAWLNLLSSQGSHPASRSSSPVSLLRRSSAGVIWMWMASLSSSSSLGCLAMSTSVVSSHLMVWWSFHACSATADFSRVPFWQVS